MHPKLKNIADQLPLIQQTYPEDAALLLYDTEKVVAYLSGEKMDLGVGVGWLMEDSKEGVGYKAYSSKEVIREERVFETGLSMIATAIPLFDNDEFIGVLTVTMSNDKVNSLRLATSELGSVVQELTASSDEMTQATNYNAQRLQDLSQNSDSVVEDIRDIHQILEFVEDVASQSHLLGLNAAIEAARSGEHGKGFAVVAQEIRKMADNSKTSVDEINKQLEQIEKNILAMNEIIQTIAANSEQHLASVEEFHTAFETISDTTKDLEKQTLI